jgi:biotin synthase
VFSHVILEWWKMIFSSSQPQVYGQWVQAGLDDQPIDRADALRILQGDSLDLLSLLQAAGTVRRRFFGNQVTVHILDNVQNGACPEDCHYCGQSKDSNAAIKPYKLKSIEEILADARAAKDSGAYRFCMVLSGRGPDGEDIEHMTQAVRQVKAMGLRTCLSSGLMNEEKARQLKAAGLDRLNHNLNTSESHYPNICTTHTYQDRMETLRAARAAGLDVCSGMIVGMGESHDDLLDVAYRLREFRTESIPVNFLLPIEGNVLRSAGLNGKALDPQTVLRVLCVFRLINPSAEVRVAAGREFHLRSLQPLALWPASSLFVDGYLLSEGSQARTTFQMIRDAGFEVAFDEGHVPEAVKHLLGQPDGSAASAGQANANGCATGSRAGASTGQGELLDQAMAGAGMGSVRLKASVARKPGGGETFVPLTTRKSPTR